MFFYAPVAREGFRLGALFLLLPTPNLSNGMKLEI